jgi:hypothetical protein
MSGDAGGERLRCGRRVEDVLLAQVAAGHGDDRDAHQRRCPHCQAALAEYDRLWAPIVELATDYGVDLLRLGEHVRAAVTAEVRAYRSRTGVHHSHYRRHLRVAG